LCVTQKRNRKTAAELNVKCFSVTVFASVVKLPFGLCSFEKSHAVDEGKQKVRCGIREKSKATEKAKKKLAGILQGLRIC
jgi:hypothetical protein